MDITLDVAQFRQRFPQFAVATLFPSTTIQTNWDMASLYITNPSDWTPCGSMSEKATALALQNMTAHLMALTCLNAGGAGGAAGITTAATIDKVSVTLASPPYGTSQWRYWLNLTPYGQALLQLLEMQAVGGFYFPGAPVVGFRGARGQFK